MLALLWALLLLLIGIPIGIPVGPVGPDPVPEVIDIPVEVSVSEFLAGTACDGYIGRGKVLVAVMRATCDGEPNEGLEPGQGSPEVLVSELEPVGTSAQGFELFYSLSDVYMCTNHCEYWDDHVVVISVPEGAVADGSEALLVAYMVDSQDYEKDDFIADVTGVTVR